MHQIHPDVGLVPLLLRMVGTSTWIYKLYVSNVTPDRSTVLSDLTELSGVSGYSPITLSASDFSLNGVSSHKGFALAGTISWTLGSGAFSVYGFFVTDSGGTQLLAVGRFDDAPISLISGAVVEMTPSVGDSSRFSS